MRDLNILYTSEINFSGFANPFVRNLIDIFSLKEENAKRWRYFHHIPSEKETLRNFWQYMQYKQNQNFCEIYMTIEDRFLWNFNINIYFHESMKTCRLLREIKTYVTLLRWISQGLRTHLYAISSTKFTYWEENTKPQRNVHDFFRYTKIWQCRCEFLW